MATTNLKSFNETFSGWGTETRNGGVAGLQGYSYAEAEKVAERVRHYMSEVRGIVDIKVSIKPMANGNYQVVNTSTYET